MQYELEPEEIRLIIESLRKNEISSRKGFGFWLARNMGVAKNAEVEEKMMRAFGVYDTFMRLRERFGDTKPVNVD